MDILDMISYGLIIFLVLFLLFLAEQTMIALYPKIHPNGYTWWFGGRRYEIDVKNPARSPYYGKKIGKYTGWLCYYSTIDDPVLKDVANQINDLAEKRHMSDTTKANFVQKFCQMNIRYVKDSKKFGTSEKWDLPINTLVDKCADCEDVAALYACLAYHCGLDVVTIDLVGPITNGVNVPAFGKHNIFNDKKYYRAECTSGFIQYVGISLGEDGALEGICKPQIPTDEFKMRLY